MVDIRAESQCTHSLTEMVSCAAQRRTEQMGQINNTFRGPFVPDRAGVVSYLYQKRNL